MDPSIDPELALTLRVSMEEERVRQEAAAKKAAEEGSTQKKGDSSNSRDVDTTDKAGGSETENKPNEYIVLIVEKIKSRSHLVEKWNLDKVTIAELLNVKRLPRFSWSNILKPGWFSPTPGSDDLVKSLRTMPFILANESFEQVASNGLQPNMILYLTIEYHLGMAAASSILFLWSATTNLMPLVGAIIADSFLGRYRTILFGCFFSLSGMTTLWLTTMIPESMPPLCDESGYLCVQQLYKCCSCEHLLGSCYLELEASDHQP